MTEDSDLSGQTHFGFRTVDAGEKAGLVRGVFDAVAPKYDLMNDLMSGGIHRLWKRALIQVLAPRAGEAFLDVAGGTGDIAFRIIDAVGLDAARAKPVTVCDINAEMLSVGRDRALDKGWLQELTWNCGDAQALPFPDMSFDAYTIAFGLRNVTDIPKALREARRVLKPGGRFFCLEFSQVAVPALEKLYDTYSFSVLPWLGGVIAGNREAYSYLAESIRKFPNQKALTGLMGEAGFRQVTFKNLTGGIAAIHTGWRI
ncbi:MAG: bifunctional demethylmenaquinone methyltransferase/2-methoxy-6-polyprenyl-1,4-benzoquinol methylase UbiE [Rhodospirillaceae bacterium]|nr:bifunctional demethylmenaquinone methyltransferase/2-methoxy-6-polyprenyl-1,4-benzoquinol methylase UbiE [Rhodospirillaceae bacterium]